MKTAEQCIEELRGKDFLEMIKGHGLIAAMENYAGQFKPKMELSPKWNEADNDGNIDIPDHLHRLFNKVGIQIRFVLLSDKNEIQAVADICRGAEEFFLS